MALNIVEYKGIQDYGMRRQNRIASLSQREQACPIDKAFPQITRSEITAKSVSSGFLNIPTNRIFGLFPIAKGTLQTNKAWIHRLAFTNVYTEEKDGVMINDQRQLTNQDVAGLNIQRNYSSPIKNANYQGNAKATAAGDVSTVKHANSWKQSDNASYISKQLNDVLQNPVVVDNIRRAVESTKLLRGNNG